jgi:hypothetical protein
MITDYTTLRTAVERWLDRADLAEQVPEFIQMAEASLQKDRRVRRQSCTGVFPIMQSGQGMPEDFREVDAWYHDGPGFSGPITVVPLDSLAQLKVARPGPGIPIFAAFGDGGELDGDASTRVYFAPEPAEEEVPYLTRLSYYRRIHPKLSDTSESNWLLAEHPDVYLYATLLESAPYLRDDERVALWEQQLNKRLDNLWHYAWDVQWSGRMRPRRRTIGG